MSAHKNNRYRFILNNVAAKIFTFFGLFVLVTFVVLITHLLSNSLPLFYSPKITYVNSFEKLDYETYLGTTIVSGKLSTVGIKDCKLKRITLQNMADTDAIPVACDKQWLSVKTMNDSVVIASFDDKGLIEFYRIQTGTQSFELQLFGSFFLPEEIDVSTKENIWSVELTGKKVHVSAVTPNTTLYIVQKTLNSTAAPELTTMPNTLNYRPLALSGFSLIQTNSSYVILDDNGNKVQSFPDNPERGIVRLPNARGFIVFEASSFRVYGVLNDNGQFKYEVVAEYDETIIGSPVSIDFNRQTGALFVLTSASELLILHPSTFEVVTKKMLPKVDKSVQTVGEFLVFNDHEKLRLYQTGNLVGVTTWKSLFSPIQYIGYEEPELIWQTSTVLPGDQAKYNITPLIIGSIKASLLALVVAVPLAVGASVFTAYFASEKVRSWLKPGIEMVEAVPTVVIGFIAAIWLAPMADKNLIAILLTLVSLPIFILAGIVTHSYWSMKKYNFQSPRRFLFVAITLFLVLFFLVINIAVYLQHLFIDTEKAWVIELIATVSLSKSALVVAIALGIAITPGIYSLIDDAINEVPKGAIVASFSLGANEVQTLFRVVLIVAMPGILSAIMLGFGRAFGETMIVLMVTGNTPVASWELLDGLRSLTSNLTIELQESNRGSVHFHILFFTASLLFLFTFCVNSFAALFKSKLLHGLNNET